MCAVRILQTKAKTKLYTHHSYVFPQCVLVLFKLIWLSKNTHKIMYLNHLAFVYVTYHLNNNLIF